MLPELYCIKSSHICNNVLESKSLQLVINVLLHIRMIQYYSAKRSSCGAKYFKWEGFSFVVVAGEPNM